MPPSPALRPAVVAPLVLLLGLAASRPLRAQAAAAEPPTGAWTGAAVLTNDWPGLACRYEGGEDPPAVRLELSRDGARGTGSVAIDVAPAAGAPCPVLRKRYTVTNVLGSPSAVTFSDSGGHEWNLLRREDGTLHGLLAWRTGDAPLAEGWTTASGVAPLTRLSGEVRLRPATAASAGGGEADALPAAGGEGQTPAKAEKVSAGQRTGHLGAVLLVNAVAAGALVAVNKAGQSEGGGAITCSPRSCVVAAPGEPCLCNANVISGAPCGSTESGVPLGAPCDGANLPCQAGFSCNAGICQDRSGVCPY